MGLGVVLAGHQLAADNPAATIFQVAAGQIGYKFFGLLLFAAGMSSVIGSTFTSTSFLNYATNHDQEAKETTTQRWLTIGFIAISTLIYIFIGQPAKVLVFVGALNGTILPIALGILLLASRKQKVMGDGYRHPIWLSITGWIVVVFMAYAACNTIAGLF